MSNEKIRALMANVTISYIIVQYVVGMDGNGHFNPINQEQYKSDQEAEASLLIAIQNMDVRIGPLTIIKIYE